MILPTFKGGLTYNGASTTIDYLLNERVKEGLAIVLKGDSELTKRLIKEASKKQKWSWSSGVLSFSETLDDKTKRDIIADFERVFFAGLSQEQFNILWVNHEDKGRTELHYIAPRLELTSQKALNPYYVKRDFIKKDLWQEKINIEYGLTSHLDSLKAVKQFKAEWAKDKKSLLKQIDEMIIPLIKSGEIDSRDDIISRLREYFEIGNINNKFLAIIDDNGKTHRLKGAIYGKDFTDFKSLAKAMEAKSKVTVNGTPRELEALEKSINEIVEKQAYGNREKFGTPVTAKPFQIVSGAIKLEPRPIKMGVSESKENLASQADEEEKNIKKEENNGRIIETIYRISRRTREAEAARARRVYERIRIASERIRTASELISDNRETISETYRVMAESLESWSIERGLRADFEQALNGYSGTSREVQRGLNSRNTKFEELIKNIKPDVVAQARSRNAEARARNKEKRLEQGKNQTI